MKKLNRLCFALVFFLHAIALFAGTPRSVTNENQLAFNQRDVRKKGINFSQIFEPNAFAFEDVRIKYSGAMRFETDDYEPSSDKPAYMTYEQIQKHLARAQASTKKVTAAQSFTTLLTGKNIELPIGIKKTVGNKDIVICLDSIIFTPTYAYGILYVIVDDTKNNKQLVFYGSNIRFTKNGGFTGDGRLDLLVTYDLKFGSTANIQFLVDEQHENYVAFDCNGFKHLHVDAKVLFAKDKFLYETEAGKLDPSKQVTVDFMADFKSLDNFMVQISNVPAFQVSGMEGTSFKINTLSFDYSSLLNPTGIVFPKDYDYPAFASGNLDYWEGFYIDGLTVKLPEEFKLKKNTTGRITFNVNQAMIDKLGFTGNINAHNIIGLRDGDMNGWDYSLDTIDVTFFKSALVEGKFSGSLVIPITKSDQQLKFSALFLPENHYNFHVELASNLNFPMWGAGSVSLSQDSWINVEILNKKFIPKASLNGSMSIGAQVNGQEGQAEDTNSDNKALLTISFQKLLIQTTGPYVSLDQNGGSFKVGSPELQQKMAKLPVSLGDIGIVTDVGPDRTGIVFTLFVNLTGKGGQDGGISGNATLTVWGKNNYQNGKTSYSFHKVEINRIQLDHVKIAVLTLEGYVDFYRDDVVYGSGFSGALNVQLELGTKDIGIDIKCIFGKKPSTIDTLGIFRYWAVDVLVSIPAIPIFPEIVKLNAIGGGISMKMGMDQANTQQNPKFVTNSGVSYVPAEDMGLGVRLMLGIQGPSRKAYEGQLMFEVLFHAGGGIKQVSFSGYIQIASLATTNPLTKLKSSMGGFVEKVKANPDSVTSETASVSDLYGEITRVADGGAIMAQWKMVYDRDNKSFTANVDVFANILGILKGAHPNDHAGRIDILFTPTKWHVFAGVPTPNATIAISLFDFVTITSYFMMGHDLIPPIKMPVPGAPNPNFPFGTGEQSISGTGFGVGARLHIGIDKGGTFYYSAGFDVGFDLLVYNVSGQICNGKPKGIKGWYAYGGAFIYAYGSAGIRGVKFGIPYPCHCGSHCSCWRGCCFRCDMCKETINFNVDLKVDIGFWGILEAANPTHVQGEFSVLGNKFPFSKGKQCQ